MRENEKHCDNCRYSYLEPVYGRDRNYLRQKCSSPDYTASTYTYDKLMEDWGRGHCRFWSPKYGKDTL